MDRRTVLIADPGEEVVLALTELLQPEFRVLSCRDGAEVLALVDREQPELLILELSLPRIDGIGLLREFSRRDIRPRILVYSDSLTNYVAYALRDLPVDYIMRKPTPAHMVAQRAGELLQPQSPEETDWWLTDLLIQLGIPYPSQGFRHMMTALPLLADSPDQFLGKALYLEIAHRNQVSFESVEKAIRDALHSGWKKGDRSTWLRYFPDAREAPKNKPFLTRIATLLCRYRRCG